jgi:drug/metabolite transporter (DMT)-like permease
MSHPSEPSNTKAALWMLGSVASFLVITVAGREATDALHTFQIMELRSVLGILLVLPMIRSAGGFAAMRSKRPMLQLGRNLAHYVGQYAWFHALTLITIAELIAIEFTTPLWTAMLAVVFLGERMTGRRTGAVALGLLGVILIVQPGVHPIQSGHLIMLGGAVFFAISIVAVKALTRTDSVVCIMFWMLILHSVIGLVPAILVWQPVPLAIWPWIFVITAAGFASHFCLARALTHADATVVAPLDFLRVPLSALLGWAIYHEQLDTWAAVGAALIVAGNALSVVNRKKSSEAPASS